MDELTIAEIQAQFASGALTSRALVESYLARIEAIDKHGPGLNSVIEINPDALAIADACDAERAGVGPRSPMHGVPVLLKDNIDTHDRMMTTAGSLALLGSIAPDDAEAARRLRKAGAVILGKTNLSEWANFRSTRSTSGWSSRGDQTHNPYALDRNPCGSSSGSAVAVAANLCAVTVGSETDGSIICPSHMNGIVGIKPTVGLISRFGIIPIAHSQDTAGPMARTVADAAILLGVLAGSDARDTATADNRRPGPGDYVDYARFLDPDGLRGARIGVARGFFGFHPDVDRIMDACIEMMRQLGAKIIDPANIEKDPKLMEAELAVLTYEFKADLNAYLARLGPQAPVHSMKEIIEFNERNRATVMPYFGQERMLLAEEKGPLTTDEYVQALDTCRRWASSQGPEAVLAQHQLDAIISPSGGPAWLTDYIAAGSHAGGNAWPAAISGCPSITVPAGYISGLPVGISFSGGAYQEATLIRLAYAFEQATQVRRPPQFPLSDSFHSTTPAR